MLLSRSEVPPDWLSCKAPKTEHGKTCHLELESTFVDKMTAEVNEHVWETSQLW